MSSIPAHVETPTKRIGEQRMTENMRTPRIVKIHKTGIAAKQMELFVSEAAAGTPSWLDLPDEVRELLIALMTMLMLDHVRTTTLAAKLVGGGDEH
jgi:hypothetical protein